MSDVREIPAVLESAAQAAASGDLPSAEALLHEVVRLQEASLGPRHADLASTFNNLAVVCEMANKPADAERFYRRSYAIASASLDPDDPLVATSLSNLREFCEARGVPLDSPVEVKAESIAVAAPAAGSLTSPATRPTALEAVPMERAPVAASAGPAVRVQPESTPSASERQAASTRTVIVGVVAAVALLAALAGFWSWGQTDPIDTSEESAAAPVASAAAPAPAAAAPSEAAPRAVTPTPPVPARADSPARTAARPAPASATSIKVLEVKLCQSLSTEGAEWRCVAPSDPARPGRLSFYTRVAASEDIRVRHRWYHGDRLVQDVGLSVRANPGAGYRTYSRQTVNASGGGNWRVEVRAPDGALLRDERFAVR